MLQQNLHHILLLPRPLGEIVHDPREIVHTRPDFAETLREFGEAEGDLIGEALGSGAGGGGGDLAGYGYEGCGWRERGEGDVAVEGVGEAEGGGVYCLDGGSAVLHGCRGVIEKAMESLEALLLDIELYVYLNLLRGGHVESSSCHTPRRSSLCAAWLRWVA